MAGQKAEGHQRQTPRIRGVRLVVSKTTIFEATHESSVKQRCDPPVKRLFRNDLTSDEMMFQSSEALENKSIIGSNLDLSQRGILL